MARLNLSTTQRHELQEIVTDRFDRAMFERTLSPHLGTEAPGELGEEVPFAQRVRTVIDAAEQASWTDDLIGALRAAQPRDERLYRYADDLGLGVRRPEGSLEKLVNEAGFIDLPTLIAGLTAAQSRVCKVEVPGHGSGTGFLVGPDLVLTNHHVVAPVVDGGDPASVRLRFDYRELMDGSDLNPGTVFTLDATGADPVVFSSPPSALDGDADRVDDERPPDEIDIALLRVAGRPGEQFVGEGDEGERRGWFVLPRDTLPSVGDRLLIVQHPAGQPIAVDVGLVEGYSPASRRIRYTANTRPGSSGSPCFDADMNVVAIHHAGDPADTPRAAYNAGIPMAAVAALLRANDLIDVLPVAELERAPTPPTPPTPSLGRRLVDWFTWGRAATLVAGVIGVIAGLIAISEWLEGDNEPPTVSGSTTASVRAGESTEIDLLEFADDDGGRDSLSASLQSALTEASGSIAMLEDGRTVHYTAPEDHLGADSFVFYVRDGRGAEIERVQAVFVRQGDIDGSPAVAVMQLAAEGTSDAEDLAEDASDRVSTVTDEVFMASSLSRDFGLVGSDEMGELVEPIEDLVPVVGADLVLYGDLTADGASSAIDLRFYLSPEEIQNAAEVAGDYPLTTIDAGAPGASVLLGRIDDRLPPSVESLTQFLEGVRLFNQKLWPEAGVSLEGALDRWPSSPGSSNGREAVLMLLGNVEIQQFDLDAAEAWYQEALTVAENTARPRFGLAEVAFQRSKGPLCGGDEPVDLDEMERALAEFEELAAVEEPVDFTVPRAKVEVGRVNLCLHQYDGRGLDASLSAFSEAIAEYDGDDSLREIVAEAHQRLAATQGQNGDWTDAAASYEAAIDKLRGDDEKEASWHRLVARIYRCELGDATKAAGHYTESEELTGEPSPPHDCEGGSG